jgi:hypothetical protein
MFRRDATEPTVELAEIEETLGRYEHSEPVVIGPGPTLPEPWSAIARAGDAATRRRAALGLWNLDFLDLIPVFAAALRSELADVRVGHIGDDAVLIYAFEHFDGASDRYVLCWIGWDPALFTDSATPLFGAIPQPLQRFYRKVHAGFLDPEWLYYGPAQPRHLANILDFVGLSDGDIEWPEEDPDPARTLVLGSTGGNVHLCVSPDLPDGQAFTVYDGVADPPEDFSGLLDHTMTAYFLDPA